MDANDAGRRWENLGRLGLDGVGHSPANNLSSLDAKRARSAIRISRVYNQRVNFPARTVKVFAANNYRRSHHLVASKHRRRRSTLRRPRQGKIGPSAVLDASGAGGKQKSIR